MGKTTKEETPADIGASAMTATIDPKGKSGGMAAWLEVMTESARFLADRFQQDLETQQAVLRCRKPEDFLRLQSEFYQKAIEQYTSEATRMTQLLSKATTRTMSDVKTAHARSYDDVPL